MKNNILDDVLDEMGGSLRLDVVEGKHDVGYQDDDGDLYEHLPPHSFSDVITQLSWGGGGRLLRKYQTLS